MSSHLKALMQLMVAHLESVTGCLTITVRLRKDGDYPYAVAHGVPPWMLTSGDSLRGDGHGDEGECAACGGGLACLCGAVIERGLDPSRGLVTEAGSFVSNSFQREADQAAALVTDRGFRGSCRRAGFESLALVPIRSEGEAIGLIMLADVRGDMLPPAMVTYVEQFASQTAETLADLIDNLLPLCVNCKRLRTLGDSWVDVESYLMERTGTRVSHTLCPECAAKLYPELSGAC